MRKVEKLINELCPNGIEKLLMKEVANVSIGEFIHKNKQNDSFPYPVYNGGISNTGYYEEYNNEGKKVLISARGANAGFVNKIEGRYWAGNSCYSISVKDESKLDWNYLYYYMKNNESKLLDKQQTGSIPSISKKQIEEFKVFVPPLEVQREIVNILDELTAYTSELTSKLTLEITTHQKQYEYYRDTLVNKEKNKYLSDILKIKNGKDYKSFGEGKIPVYGSGGIITYTSKFAYDKPSVLIPRKGSIDKLYYVEEPFWNVDTIFYTEIDETLVMPKYVFYCLENEHLEELNTAGGVPSLTQSVLNNVQIYVPSLDEQKEVVNKLDDLSSLVTAISKELLIEIEARKKQYEYYRDKLLSFKEVKVNE